MKVLSVIAQKPNSTGSGVYFKELVRCMSNMNIKQEIICATYDDSDISEYNNIANLKINPIYFNSSKLPISIAGMSDVMPYKSMRYSDFIDNNESYSKWENAFLETIEDVYNRFKPDIIICHHLYILTSLVRELCKDVKVYGLCHNTDLRQFLQTNLKREFIKKNISNLDQIYFPSKYHLDIAKKIFDLDENKCKIIGIGYNSEIFYDKKVDIDKKKNRILYVGKIAKKKGVLSLVKAFNSINNKNISLDIVGGIGDEEEYYEIVSEAKIKGLNIYFHDAVSQNELSDIYNNHELFILPSFSEGIPMVPIEAMACGCKIVISDLPGVKDFYRSIRIGKVVSYVQLPELSNVDDASVDELKKFEKRLANTILKALSKEATLIDNISNVSWKKVTNEIFNVL